MAPISSYKKILQPTALIVAMILVAIGFLSIIEPTSTEAAWYSSGGTWSYRKQITVDHDKVATSSALVNFPMLFSVTDPELKYTSHGGRVASSTGGDLVFTSSDGATLLDFEIEKYASTTGETVVWVEIPSLSGIIDTTIYVYFGNASAPNNQDPTGVWDSGFQAVYHLGEGYSTAAGFYQDSTSNNRDGTLVDADGDTAQMSGKIGNAIGFNGDGDYIDTNSTLGDATFTAQAWVILDTEGSNHYVYFEGGASGRNMGYLLGGDAPVWVFNTGIEAGSPHTPGTLYKMDYIYNGTDGLFYLNGVQVDSATFSPAAGGELWIAEYNGGGGFPWDGMIDEFRMSATARGSDWITTEYRNQSSPSTFFAYGSTDSSSRSVSTSNVKIVSSAAVAGAPGWYGTSGTWTYRKRVTVDATKVATTSALTNFPLLVSVTDPDLRFTSHGGKVASSTGLELVFTSSNGTTKLDYELEHYASTTGETVAWVEIPSLSGVTDTTIYMYFGGNASAINIDQSNKTGVWDSNFKGVWHMAEASGNLGDSTSGAHTATAANLTYGSTGRVDGAITRDNSINDTISVADHADLEFSTGGDFTLSSWVKVTANPTEDTAVMQKRTSSTAGYEFIWNRDTGAGHTIRGVGGADVGGNSNTTTSLNTWYLIHVRRASGTSYLYVNGAFDRSAANTVDTDSTDSLDFGYDGLNGRYLPAVLDEFRVSNSARGADWIATEYRNQSSPSQFYSYGGLESYGGRQSHATPASSISVVSSTQSTSGASPAINTTGATLIVIQESRFGATPGAPTDSAGNTWTALANHNDGGAYHVRYYYVCGPTTSASHTFTPGSATWTSIAAFSGTVTSDCYDAGTDQSAKATTTTSYLPAITPSQSGNLIVSSATENTGGADSFFAVGQSLSIVQSKTPNPVAGFAWRQYNSVTPLSVSWTVGNSVDTQMVVAAFKVGTTATRVPVLKVRGGVKFR